MDLHRILRGIAGANVLLSLVLAGGSLLLVAAAHCFSRRKSFAICFYRHLPHDVAAKGVGL